MLLPVSGIKSFTVIGPDLRPVELIVVLVQTYGRQSGPAHLRSSAKIGISSDAIAGFVGVVTGAVTTGGFQPQTVLRTEKRKLRGARPLVLNELAHAQSMLNDAKTDARVWKLIVSDVHTDAWDRYADDLARDRKHKFGTVAAAYRAIQGLHRIIPIGPPDANFTADATNAIDNAVDHLGSSCRAWPPARCRDFLGRSIAGYGNSFCK